LHLDAAYADALLLTGNPEDAADLVEAAYVYAFQRYELFGRRCVPAQLRARATRAWLLENLHIVFCESILSFTEMREAPMGERS